MSKMMSENPSISEIRNIHLRNDLICADKARGRGQLTFTIVEQDRSAVITIAEWIKLNIMTAPPAKLYEALETALSMRDSQVEKKNAD